MEGQRQQELQGQERVLGLLPAGHDVTTPSLDIPINAGIQAGLNHLGRRTISPCNGECVFIVSFCFQCITHLSFHVQLLGGVIPFQKLPIQPAPIPALPKLRLQKHPSLIQLLLRWEQPSPPQLPTDVVNNATPVGPPVPTADAPVRVPFIPALTPAAGPTARQGTEKINCRIRVSNSHICPSSESQSRAFC